MPAGARPVFGERFFETFPAKSFHKMKTVLPLLAAATLLASCSGGPGISRDGAADEANVDSSAPAASSADVGEESRNVDFRSSTSALPDSAHPSANHNANGQMVNEGQSRDGNPQ